MITITVLGIDPYLGRQLSKELTPSLANLYQSSLEDIFFNVPETFFLWNGVEQNSWNILIRVNAPQDFAFAQDDVASLLADHIKNLSVHCSIEFYYYYEENRYEFVDEEHPKFVTDTNAIFEGSDENDEEFEEESEESEGDTPYLENMFKDLNL